jgi:glycerol kinase
MRAVLAIDQGTTGSTALVLSQDGTVLSRAYREISARYPQPGWVEQDPEELVRKSLEAIAESLDRAGLAPGELGGIGITNQRETTVLWERRTGRAIGEAIVWQSRQTQPLCNELRKRGHQDDVRKRTGLVIDPYFSATKIRWILDSDPEVAARAESGEILFGTVDTWLLWRLTGGTVHATDPTNASRTLLFNTAERSWDPELLHIFGVPACMLPEVRPSAGFFGNTVAQGGLPGDIPIMAVAGDQQAALYGQGCWSAGQAKNTYGTGCFLMMNTGSSRCVSQGGGLLATLACDETGRSCHALEGSVFVAGSAVQWLRDGLGLIAEASETEGLAQSVPDTQGVYMVPAFVGLGAPYWDPEARGALLGLTRGAGRAHLVRATLESIAYQSRDVIDAMNTTSALPLRALRVDGGATSNNFLMQFQADILGVPVYRPTLVEMTAFGAARLAGVALGLWRSERDFDPSRQDGTIFEPCMSEARRTALYEGWKHAVERVRTITI